MYPREYVSLESIKNPRTTHVPKRANSPVRPAAAGVVVSRRDALDELGRGESVEEAFFDGVLVALAL